MGKRPFFFKFFRVREMLRFSHEAALLLTKTKVHTTYLKEIAQLSIGEISSRNCPITLSVSIALAR